MPIGESAAAATAAAAAASRLRPGGGEGFRDGADRERQAGGAGAGDDDDSRGEQRRGPRDQGPQEEGGDLGPGGDPQPHRPPARDGRAFQHLQVQQAAVGADLGQDEGPGLRSVPHNVHRQVAEPAQGVQEVEAAVQSRRRRPAQDVLLQGDGGAPE